MKRSARLKSVLTTIEAAKRTHSKTLSFGRRINTLPPELYELTKLQSLSLSNQKIREFSPEIRQLEDLHTIYLRRCGLTNLPPEICLLPNLKNLYLDENKLSELPPEIGLLTNLQTLSLRKNGLRKLPPEIGALTNLKSLDLTANKLNDLPPELGQLDKLRSISIEGTPLNPALKSALNSGIDQFKAYLRSLVGVPQYEAKILLVGEGEVGKTSLLAALRNEPFLYNRPTTHGIELKTIKVNHPNDSIDDDLTLNFWDFGGQEVYQITHQFFFSQHALYLLVWKPRQGQHENKISEWLERIELRVGDTARVFLVATHCNERVAELDYPSLKSTYGHILVGHCEIDSADNTGIPELRYQIATIVSSLDHAGTQFNSQWLNVRDRLKELDKTHIAYAEHVDICSQHGLSSIDAKTLINLLNMLGHVVFYDSDGLRDFIVLKPEWLTKAIGYILEDRQTRKEKGILDHYRLDDIWNTHGNPGRTTYPPKYFPYFLRLMEQYDVSARIENTDSSLVPQMVPYERPKLDWTLKRTPQSAELTLICEIDQTPIGLIAWVTARNHRWTTGLHWRNGVFLRHEHGHEALLTYVTRRKHELTAIVRGEYPAYFMHVLQDGLEYLIDERWPYLTYRFYIPCRKPDCEGRFGLETLYKARKMGKKELDCHRCLESAIVIELIEGFSDPTGSLVEQLDSINSRLEEATMDRQAMLAHMAEMVRRLLNAFLSEARNGPRLFSFEPVDIDKWKPRYWGREQLRLTLWCEHPDHQHPLGDEGQFIVDQPKEWVMKIAPYANLILQLLRTTTLVTAGIGGVGAATNAVSAGVAAQLVLMEKMTKAAMETVNTVGETEERIEHEFGQAIGVNAGTALRDFHDLLEHVGWKPGTSNLRRVTDKKTGDILWVCPKHYIDYDPGLPILPEQL